MLSRRDFLKVMGVSVLAGVTPLGLAISEHQFASNLLPETFSPVKGRVLRPLQLGATSLFADTLVSIQGEVDESYLTQYGPVPRADIQPMLESTPGEQSLLIGDFAEVIAPSAAIRRWAEAHAPLVSRVGHGGVLQVADEIALSDTNRWLLMAREDGTALGWSQVHRWQPVKAVSGSAFIHHLAVDKRRRMLTAYQDQTPLLRVPIALQASVAEGEYQIAETAWTKDDSSLPTFEGIPYWFSFGKYWLSGAYWHNAFGMMDSGDLPGAGIQVAVFVGQWLYRHLGRSVTISVD
jgi:hypothetical protein